MREFSESYLRDTRAGMWDDSRQALAALDLQDCDSILDVGCGTGELSRVLAEESGVEVLGVDADTALLDAAREHASPVAGDATRLPFPDNAVDLVVCQALLINLSDPAAAIEEFARVASKRVAAVEPDNAAVTVESSVEAEAKLAAHAREAYLDGVGTDITLGGSPTAALFEQAGLGNVTTARYDHERIVSAPYSQRDLDAAKRKATGDGLAADRAEMQAGGLTDGGYDRLRSAWREMGRAVIEQMQTGEYRRREVVPFFVTTGVVE
ncbi:class I SAM-dependent methyltransferase [Natranaeroarchaeum sulfidigenes]|uniref:SAM-dependent methyltransferase n=1 Tax=Natranaeroarchaeum sulfidigenes TaxID=2784880 RepID=A0A897MUA9_9EURY|nr:methyltransferase domain-containing protein [Natranaeroarchaeum sulfidigenes]QSG03618.1 SAM-dependent methyltransferase [Natranaeroarchaeum sulfidigenes]